MMILKLKSKARGELRLDETHAQGAMTGIIPMHMYKTNQEIELQTEALSQRCLTAAAFANHCQDKPGLTQSEIYEFKYLEMLLWETARGLQDTVPFLKPSE
jgi:hypothetical protein